MIAYSDSTSIIGNVTTSSNITIGTGTIPNSNVTTKTVYVSSAPRDDSFNSLLYNAQPPLYSLSFDPEDIKQVIEYVPNKVYKFIFYDGVEIKTVCDPEDEFNFDYAFYLAIAKKIWSKELTLEGVMQKANEFRTTKKIIKKVEKAKKQFYKDKEEKQKEEEKKKLEKEKKKKLIEKKKLAKKRKEQNEINKIVKAIKISKEEE